MKELLDFIERHKTFIKRIIIFTIAYFVIAIVNNPEVTQFFTTMFGEYITTAIHAVIPTFLLTTEV